MNIEPNKFYKCKNYYLLVYPSKEKVATSTCTAVERVEYCSKELNCEITYSEKDSVFLVLETGLNYIKILSKDTLGWISYREWLNLVAVT